MKKRMFNPILVLLSPITFFSTLWLKLVLKLTEPKTISDKIFMKLGVLPVPDNYYSPLINPLKYLKNSLSKERNLPGINLNIDSQLEVLKKFNYKEELSKFPLEKTDDFSFYYENKFYEFVDAEYLYCMIRYFKPKRIIEIGGGYSTLMIKNAVIQNKNEDSRYECHHICIEPYENKWLNSIGTDLIRKKVEDVDFSYFKELEANDVVFIDSSHIIRPQGDLLFEILEILPVLNKGVVVHFHDIYTPGDYPDYLLNKHILWNEQYILEAFLSLNKEYEIIASLNYLYKNYKNEIFDRMPIKPRTDSWVPGAFWLIRK